MVKVTAIVSTEDLLESLEGGVFEVKVLIGRVKAIVTRDVA